MLSPTWITDHTLDLEYKRYLVLDYVQQVDKGFGEGRIEPNWSDLRSHISHIQSLAESHEHLAEQLRGPLKGIDLEKGEFIYDIPELGHWDQLRNIMAFAMNKFTPLDVQASTLMQEFIEQSQLQYVGLTPLYDKEGYLLIHPTNHPATTVYYYRMANIQLPDATQPPIQTEFVEQYGMGLHMDYSRLKRLLVSKYELPNPAVFALTTTLALPTKETLLPIAKKLLGKFLA